MSHRTASPRLLAVLLSCLAGVARAQTADAPPPGVRQDVSVNLIGPIAGLVLSTVLAQDILPIGVELERRLDTSWTGYVGPGAILGTVFGKPLAGGTLSVGARFFPGARAPSGLWFGPEATGTLTSGLGARVWTVSLSAFGGYNLLFFERWLVSAGLGLGLRAGTLGLGALPAVRLCVGYAF